MKTITITFTDTEENIALIGAVLGNQTIEQAVSAVVGTQIVELLKTAIKSKNEEELANIINDLPNTVANKITVEIE